MASKDGYSLCVVERNTDEWREFHRIRRTALFRQSEAEYDVEFQDAFMPALAARANLLLKFNGKAVGLLSLDNFGDGRAAIRAVAVATDEQGRGHGRQLVNLTSELARSQGVDTLCVNAGAGSGGFYRRLEFSDQEWCAAELGEYNCGNSKPVIEQLVLKLS